MWKGKDQQGASDLQVPVVPIYIQEKIHPQALVENMRDTAKAGEPEPEQLLFSDFNGLPDFDARVDFYQHDQHWANRMVLGDSLLVMTSLAEKEGLKGKVQCIDFGPHVTEEAKRYGSLTVLVTRMNPDLAMGSDLLKRSTRPPGRASTPPSAVHSRPHRAAGSPSRSSTTAATKS